MEHISFFRDERGQDLVEYTLLLAMITIAGAALFLGQDKSIRNIWDLATNNLKTVAGN
ncbi:MAG: Flp family type IVb pilin [Bryobacteraceae bacterium]